MLKKLYATMVISPTSTLGPSAVVNSTTNRILDTPNDPRLLPKNRSPPAEAPPPDQYEQSSSCRTPTSGDTAYKTH